MEQEYDGRLPFVIDLPFFEVESRGLYRTYLKRVFDVALVLVAAIPVLSIVLLFAALVAMDGKNPFYTQVRIGKGGRKYRIWKLRSMVANADDMLGVYLASNPDAAKEWQTTQKLKNDPRITRVGRFIRKSSIDELPQLWNVLNGTMSLVGPRPIMEDQEQLYRGKGYYGVRPGITGPWQVSARHNSGFAERVWYDDNYNRSLSFRSDVALILKTFKVVFQCTGV
ncbi:sugar transferase [Primorskyibacter sp. 2E233]|uniref:sugar transferase n=1 Tax=Primorskyibacter sp. 2E233 TaxID=3413431 RepID=UPI003BF2D8BD